MTVRIAAFLLAFVAILSLNLILFLGAVVHDPAALGLLRTGLVLALDASILCSSGLLGYLLLNRNRWLARVFLLNIGIFLAATVLRLSGVRFPQAILFAADIYWLNLYVATLARYGPTLVRR